MKDTALTRLVQVHKALAHPARLRILGMVRSGELCVCQITAVLKLAPSTVSAHLKELRIAGLIEERKDGRWVWSRPTDDPQLLRVLEPLFETLDDDPTIRADGALLNRVREVDPNTLCRADLDLETLGLLAEAGNGRDPGGKG